jgi:hypothetical protein
MVQRTHPFSVRVSEASIEAYKEAAERAGLSASEWARLVLDVAAGVSEIRFVFHLDVGSKTPEEAIEFLDATKKKLKAKDKVRDGKW